MRVLNDKLPIENTIRLSFGLCAVLTWFLQPHASLSTVPMRYLLLCCEYRNLLRYIPASRTKDISSYRSWLFISHEKH